MKSNNHFRSKNLYFKRVPLIEKWTQLTLPLIPLFSANKGIREDERGTALLLRGLSKNKGFMKKRNELFLNQIAHFLQSTLRDFVTNPIVTHTNHYKSIISYFYN